MRSVAPLTRQVALVFAAFGFLPVEADSFYVTLTGAGEVREISTDVTPPASVATIPGVGVPSGIAARSDGKYVFVADIMGNLRIINTDKTDSNGDGVKDHSGYNTVVASIPLAAPALTGEDFFAQDVAVTTDGNYVFVTGLSVLGSAIDNASIRVLSRMTSAPPPGPGTGTDPVDTYALTHVLQLWGGGFESPLILHDTDFADANGDGVDDGDALAGGGIFVEVITDDSIHLPWAVLHDSASNRVFFSCYLPMISTLAGPLYHGDVHAFKVTDLVSAFPFTGTIQIRTAGLEVKLDSIENLAEPHQIENPYDIALSQEGTLLLISCSDTQEALDILSDPPSGSPIEGKVISVNLLGGGIKGPVKTAEFSPPADADKFAKPHRPVFLDPLGLKFSPSGAFIMVCDRDQVIGTSSDGITGNIGEQVAPVPGSVPDTVTGYLLDPTPAETAETHPRLMDVAFTADGSRAIFLNDPQIIGGPAPGILIYNPFTLSVVGTEIPLPMDSGPREIVQLPTTGSAKGSGKKGLGRGGPEGFCFASHAAAGAKGAGAAALGALLLSALALLTMAGLRSRAR